MEASCNEFEIISPLGKQTVNPDIFNSRNVRREDQFESAVA